MSHGLVLRQTNRHRHQRLPLSLEEDRRKNHPKFMDLWPCSHTWTHIMNQNKQHSQTAPRCQGGSQGAARRGGRVLGDRVPSSSARAGGTHWHSWHTAAICTHINFPPDLRKFINSIFRICVLGNIQQLGTPGHDSTHNKAVITETANWVSKYPISA